MSYNPQLVQWFQTVDTDRSGHVSAKELQRALAMGQLHFSLALCARMIRLYDRDNSGTIDFNEFQQLHGFLMGSHASFHHFDQDRSGSLSPHEVYQALQHAGFRLDQPAFNAMFSAWDPDRSGTLGMDEFIAMCVFMQSLTKVFGAFDAQRTGTVTLTFNQMVYAAAHAC